MTPTASQRAPALWSLSTQIFIYLQLLDAVTTWIGFQIGLAEASPFVQFLMRGGTLLGLLGSKFIAAAIGGYCVWRDRYKVISLINYWYAGIVIWNLALIVWLSGQSR